MGVCIVIYTKVGRGEERRRTFVREFGGILGSCVRSTCSKQYQQTCQKHVSRRAPHLEPGAEDQVLFESTRGPPPPPTSDRHPHRHSTDPPRVLESFSIRLDSIRSISSRRPMSCYAASPLSCPLDRPETNRRHGRTHSPRSMDRPC